MNEELKKNMAKRFAQRTKKATLDPKKVKYEPVATIHGAYAERMQKHARRVRSTIARSRKMPSLQPVHDLDPATRAKRCDCLREAASGVPRLDVLNP